MGAVRLLEQATAAGLVLRVDGDHLRVQGPKAAARLVAELAVHKHELLAILTGRLCGRCGEKPATVTAYWGAHLCESCCRSVADENDHHGWPPVAWPDYIDVWTAIGSLTGHVWLVCDLCDERQLLGPDKAGRMCHLTTRCTGRMRLQPVEGSR